MTSRETDSPTSGNLELIRSLMPESLDFVEVVNSENPGAFFGDIAMRHISPDVEVVFAAPPTGGPGRDFHGIQGFVEGWRDWLEAYHTYRITPEEFIDAGDSVVVHVHVVARTERHGVEVEHRPSSVWTVEDGMIVAVVFFLDRDDALTFAGIA